MLRIEKIPNYISPSALNMAEKMPNTFFLKRLINDPFPSDPQSLNAAVGSAFDYYIKMRLINDKFHNQEKLLIELREGIETNIDEAFSAGKTAYEAYTQSAYNVNEFANVEVHASGLVEGVQMFGKQDSNVYDLMGDPTLIIPHDWKSTGYQSTSTSPKPGYYEQHQGCRIMPCHKKYVDDIQMENIDKSWAGQLGTYGWLNGIKVGTPFPVRVDQLVFKGPFIRTITKYRAWITEQFQESLILRYQNLWRSLNDGSFVTRLANRQDENIVWYASTKENWW